MKSISKEFSKVVLLMSLTASIHADESLFGIAQGAETLPSGAMELIQHVYHNSDKGAGSYKATYTKTELEYGVTDRLTASIYILGQSVETKGFLVDGYIPADHEAKFEFSGIEANLKYNFLSPSKEFMGLAGYFSLVQASKDPHSGQDKKQTSFETKLLAQKYFLDGELIFVADIGLEGTLATRGPVTTSVEWTTDPEAELGIQFATGLTYRFAPKWFIGAEIVYDTEYETEVGQERWSYQAGPSIHYGSQKWWTTLSWLPQLKGGGEQFDAQDDKNLHLIERTKQEVRFQIGLNF